MKPDREFSARFLRFHMTAISRKIGIFVSVMEKIRFVALIFCLSFLYAICDAQEHTPVVSQFDKEDYMAANQNWAVSQDADGIMYFGNGCIPGICIILRLRRQRSLCSEVAVSIHVLQRIFGQDIYRYQ